MHYFTHQITTEEEYLKKHVFIFKYIFMYEVHVQIQKIKIYISKFNKIVG